jgi:hypothetical protein
VPEVRRRERAAQRDIPLGGLERLPDPGERRFDRRVRREERFAIRLEIGAPTPAGSLERA